MDDYKKVFSYIDVNLRNKYYNGLTGVDLDDFNQVEWQLAFELPADEFKRRFMDKMNFDDLFDMVYELGYENIEGWCLQLVADDYKKFTDSEWKLFFYIIDDSVKIRNFVNEVVDDDPAILMHVLKQIDKKTHKMKDDTAHYWDVVKKFVHKKRNQGVPLAQIYLPEDYEVGIEKVKDREATDESVEREVDKIMDDAWKDPLSTHLDFGE